MFRHSLLQETGKSEAVIVISGDAVFTQAQEMESALSAALQSCRHLIIEIGGVEAFDSTFQVLLCSLHRRSELENKKISLQGIRRENEPTWQARLKGCLLNENTRCPLWEPILKPGAEGRRTG